MAASGACCRVASARGPRCTPNFALGGSPGSGSNCRRRCANGCVGKRGERRRPAPPSWRSRRPSGADPWLRWREETLGAQAPLAGRYAGRGARRTRAPGRHSGPLQRPWRLRRLQPPLPRLELLWADSAYLGPLQTEIQETFGWRLQIVKRPGGGRRLGLRADQEPPSRLPGFQPAPHRWIVERSFAWIGRTRRMSKEYEFLPASSEAWIALSMIRLMPKRLAGERIWPAFHYRPSA